MRSKLLHAIAWVTARHIAHFQAWEQLVSRIGSFLMLKANPAEFHYYTQVQEQLMELQELKALDAAFEIKKLATNEIGETHWPDHAAIGLNMVAGVLIEQHDWDPDDVHDFVEDLTSGYFNFQAVDDEDDE